MSQDSMSDSERDPVYPDRHEVEDLKAEARTRMTERELPSRWFVFGGGIAVGIVIREVVRFFSPWTFESSSV